MDINTLRGLSTVLVFIAFIGICWWAFSPKRRKQFEEAARLPFADELPEQSQSSDTKESQTDDASKKKEQGQL